MIFKRTKRLANGTTKEYPAYWYRFKWNGRLVRVNTKQPNKQAAAQLESQHRTQLAKGEAGIRDRSKIPTLKEYEPQFMGHIEVRCAEKPRTVTYYREKMANMVKFPPLGSAKLDRIDESLIEKYVQARSKEVMPATVNRHLATLRRALRLAQEWNVIDRVPRIRMLPGERNREFVLSHGNEPSYLEATPSPLRDAAVLILDTGLRVGEAIGLRWPDVHLEPVGAAKFGYVHVCKSKSRNAQRNVSLTARAKAMLAERKAGTVSEWVFPGEREGRAIVGTSLSHQHKRVRDKLNLPGDFVIHWLRHTMLTRLGEAGVDAFTIMRIAGHSSVTVSQRYVHPSSEAMERAFERLEAFNLSSGKKGGHTEGTPIPEVEKDAA
jgi:integrase